MKLSMRINGCLNPESMKRNTIIKPAGKKSAAVTLIGIFSLSIIFHLMVLPGIVPDDIVWEDRPTGAVE